MASGDTRKVILKNTDDEILIPYTEIASSTTAGRVKPDGTTTSVDSTGAMSVIGKQDTLVSGTNIKTINGSSVLGSGDLPVTAQAAWGSITGTLSNQADLQNALNAKQGTLTFDSTPTSGSSNPVTSGGIYTALNAKQDVATAVNYDNISNCITEIPQDIKLELNNGTLTLKAGSKLYLPNGFEQDGTTPHFDVITIDSDKTRTGGGGGYQTMFFWDVSSNGIRSRYLPSMYSGPATPSDLTSVTWYDTTENKIKFYSTSTTPDSSTGCLPLCLCTGNSSTVIQSIDQVFNGFGYIGSTYFALPGIKGLIPNGRNTDGTLKNIEITNSSVKTVTFPGTPTFSDYCLRLSSDSLNITNMYYDEINNLNIHKNGNVLNSVIIGKSSATSGRITSFTPKTAFHAVDYNEFEKAMLKEDWVKVSTLPANPDPDKFYYIPEN